MKLTAPLGRILLGALMALSLPPFGLWVFAPLAIGVYLKYSRDASYRRQFANAFALWVGYFAAGLTWMTDLTVAGWLAAIPVQALITALPMAFVPSTGLGRAVGLPAALVVGETTRWVIPFGGVPMSSLAMGPIDTYLVDVVRISGPLLLIALIGILAIACEGAISRNFKAVWISISLSIALVALAQVSPRGEIEEAIVGSVVQAGGDLGTRAATSSQGDVFRRHLEAMELQDSKSDLIVWSESSVTVNAPLEESRELNAITRLASELDAVIIANFSEIDGNNFRNASVAVNPTSGIGGRYDKVHLVPFGEYIPLRGLVENFADLSLIPREALPGSGPGILDSALGPIGNVISFEVYFPERVRSGIRAGATIITNPTLASSYTNSLVPEQSLASARLRAIESDRWVLQASTTGYSAIVAPDGQVVAESRLRDQAVLTENVELRRGNTWATNLGKLPISFLAFGLLPISHLISVRRRELL